MEARLIELGGKLWEKGNCKRIYIKEQVIRALINCKTTEFEDSCLKKANTYYDIVGGQFKSDIGTVRVLLNRSGYKCTK
ncbi:hypothetical protein [Geovibrio ferrireducens]|uniref:hypothetical protein n=1 Tax=Geovibrio ferrireducens TaxID=46201 RepID=UPI002245DB68|nr:hypothetical protein [Geovibrio ferrireducens]